MPIKIYKEILNSRKKVNLVNLKEDLIKKGLKPLYIDSKPLYINLSNNIFYCPSNHYECNLNRDVETALTIINSKEYDRFDSNNFLNSACKTIDYIIYNRNIYFPSTGSLYIYKKYERVRREIKRKYNLNSTFYEPTQNEIFADYYEKIILNNLEENKKIEYIYINLTPEEWLDLFYNNMLIRCTPIELSDELTGNDVRSWININANIFNDYDMQMQGVYNDETKKIINSMKQTKKEIYYKLYKMAIESKNRHEMINNLLASYQVFEHYIPSCNFQNLDIREQENIFSRIASDILVTLVGFDKIETVLNKTITTSKVEINKEFFNYKIFDFDIVKLPKLIYDSRNSEFNWICQNEFIQTSEDKEYENEINLIKKLVPYNERYKYIID